MDESQKISCRCKSRAKIEHVWPMARQNVQGLSGPILHLCLGTSKFSCLDMMSLCPKTRAGAKIPGQTPLSLCGKTIQGNPVLALYGIAVQSCCYPVQKICPERQVSKVSLVKGLAEFQNKDSRPLFTIIFKSKMSISRLEILVHLLKEF